MTTASETTGQHGQTATHAAPGHPVPAQPTSAQPAPAQPAPAQPASAQPASAQPTPAQPGAGPVTGQQRAHRVLAELLDLAAAQNLPAIDWTLAAFEPRLIGRCTAYPGPGRRRADFEAWRAVLGADATEEASGEQPVRLTARAERDEGRVTIEIAADLYDDLPDAAAPAPARTWRSP
jgi:hypothetical protein